MQRLSPLKWYGSKVRLTGRLLELIPPHEKYVEVFGGSAALLFCKPPSRTEVYNDIDDDLVSFFEVLRDPTLARRLRALLKNSPYAREEYRRCAANFEAETDPVERARQFYLLVHQSINGRFKGGWSRDRRSSRVKQFTNGQKLLEAAAERLRNVDIEKADFQDIIRYYDGPSTFFYLDPPYIPETRSASHRYEHEMSLEDHERLLSVVTKVEGKVLLHGFSHRRYEERLANWSRMEVKVSCASTVMKKDKPKRKRPTRQEAIWMNYGPPEPPKAGDGA